MGHPSYRDILTNGVVFLLTEIVHIGNDDLFYGSENVASILECEHSKPRLVPLANRCLDHVFGAFESILVSVLHQLPIFLTSFIMNILVVNIR